MQGHIATAKLLCNAHLGLYVGIRFIATNGTSVAMCRHQCNSPPGFIASNGTAATQGWL